MPSEMEEAPHYTVLYNVDTVDMVYTVDTVDMVDTVDTVYIIQTDLHCLNSRMYAYC